MIADEAQSPPRAPSAPSAASALAPRSAVPASSSLLTLAAEGSRLVAAPAPDPRTTDAYLRVAARVLLEGERSGVRTVGVVSANAEEGKTAAAVNLAVCLGRARGREGRVLLVDGDARARSLSRMFCGPEPADAPPRAHPMLVGTALEGVDLLTAPICYDGLALAAPSAWVRVLREVSAVYPHVVVDCPAVLDDPEGLVLRECVERLVVVVRAGRTSRRKVARTIGSLGARVLGVVLNARADGVERADRR